VDLYREATLRSCAPRERGIVGDGADHGQSETVMVVDAGAAESLDGLEAAVDLLGVRDRSARFRVSRLWRGLPPRYSRGHDRPRANEDQLP
jgi:hypothetical protein